MQFRLRTLLIVLAILPPLLWFGWMKYEAWRAWQKDIQAEKSFNNWRFGYLRTATIPLIIGEEEPMAGVDNPVTP